MVLKKGDQEVNASILQRMGNKIITGGRGRERPGSEGGGEGKRGKDQVLEETGEKYRGLGNRIKYVAVEDEELWVATRKSQTLGKERLPGPKGDDFI